MFPKWLWCSVVCLLWCQIWCADTSTEASEKVSQTSVAPASLTPSSSSNLGIPQNMMQILSQGGVVALGVLVLGALAALAMPLFGYRYCQLLGNCDTNNFAYSPPASNIYQNDPYGQYTQAYPSSNTYQKRSVDYMGPVLHLLKTAYDKYGQTSPSSSIRKAT